MNPLQSRGVEFLISLFLYSSFRFIYSQNSVILSGKMLKITYFRTDLINHYLEIVIVKYNKNVLPHYFFHQYILLQSCFLNTWVEVFFIFIFLNSDFIYFLIKKNAVLLFLNCHWKMNLTKFVFYNIFIEVLLKLIVIKQLRLQKRKKRRDIRVGGELRVHFNEIKPITSHSGKKIIN